MSEKLTIKQRWNNRDEGKRFIRGSASMFGVAIGGMMGVSAVSDNASEARQAMACIKTIDEVGSRPLLSALSPAAIDDCHLSEDIRTIKNDRMPSEYGNLRVDMPLRADQYDIVASRNTAAENRVTISVSALAGAALMTFVGVGLSNIPPDRRRG